MSTSKITNFNSLIFFSGAELLSTKVSNTFNPSFFRGSANAPNFYTKIPYDYFSYQGRRMGAHSGTSSDDLIFLVGLRKENRNLFISYNFERHGIKSMTYPEIKKEISLLLQFEHENGQRVSITFENEKINNFGFEKNKLSISNFIWFSYSFNINKVY